MTNPCEDRSHPENCDVANDQKPVDPNLDDILEPPVPISMTPALPTGRHPKNNPKPTVPPDSADLKLRGSQDAPGKTSADPAPKSESVPSDPIQGLRRGAHAGDQRFASASFTAAPHGGYVPARAPISATAKTREFV